VSAKVGPAAGHSDSESIMITAMSATRNPNPRLLQNNSTSAPAMNKNLVTKPASSNDDDDNFKLFTPLQKSQYARCLGLCDKIEGSIQPEDILAFPTATSSGPFKTKSMVRIAERNNLILISGILKFQNDDLKLLTLDI
jgi:hypothetical protein